MVTLPKIDGAFRDGACLVLNADKFHLPSRCLVTGETVQEALPVKFSAWSPMMVLGTLDAKDSVSRFGPIAIRTVQLNLPLLPAQVHAHHYRGFMLAVGGVLLSFVAGVLWLQAGMIVPVNRWLAASGCVTGLGMIAFGMHHQLSIHSPLRVKRITANCVWLSGVCPEVLELFPDWQRSSEGQVCRKQEFYWNAAIGAVGLLLALVLSYYWLPSSLEAISSQNWQETTGKIVSSRITTDTEKLGGGKGMQRQSRTYYEIHCEYEYACNGQTFVGKRRSFGASPRTISKHSAESDLKRAFSVGTPVSVLYDRSTPERCSLARASMFEIASLTAPMLIAWLVAIGAAMRAIRIGARVVPN